MFDDYILNGQASGDVASQLMDSNFDVSVLRPWKGRDGRSYITVNSFDSQGKPIQTAMPVQNATATLRKDEWIQLDQAIVAAAKPRLRAVADLRGAGLVYTIPNGMAKTVLQTESQSDISEADISMDGLRRTAGDRPQYDLTNLPLPILHKDFSFSARQIAASRNGGSPLDTTMAELAGRRVAEKAEQLLLGVDTSGNSVSYAYGGGTIQGYTNFSSRLTKSLTLPTASAWTGATLVQEVLEMRSQAQGAYHYGPYKLYFSPNWDSYLDDDYSSNKGDLTLRERIAKIKGITSVETLDYLSGYTVIMVQQTSDVARMVIGMDITTVQWESQGGMQVNFKVMAIMVPHLRADINGNTGIVHGTGA